MDDQLLDTGVDLAPLAEDDGYEIVSRDTGIYTPDEPVDLMSITTAEEGGMPTWFSDLSVGWMAGFGILVMVGLVVLYRFFISKRSTR